MEKTNMGEGSPEPKALTLPELGRQYLEMAARIRSRIERIRGEDSPEWPEGTPGARLLLKKQRLLLLGEMYRDCTMIGRGLVRREVRP